VVGVSDADFVEDRERDRGVLAGQEAESSCKRFNDIVDIEKVLFVSDSHTGLEIHSEEVKTQFETVITPELADPVHKMSHELFEKIHLEIFIPVS
jgi:hypothetical protein